MKRFLLILSFAAVLLAPVLADAAERRIRRPVVIVRPRPVVIIGR